MINDHTPGADEKVKDALIKALDSDPKTAITRKNIVGQQKVDPTIANGLKKSAALTVIFCDHHHFNLYTDTLSQMAV